MVVRKDRTNGAVNSSPWNQSQGCTHSILDMTKVCISFAQGSK